MACYRLDKNEPMQPNSHSPPMLRRLREAAGLTQRELAAKPRLTHVAVHKSETGERRVDVAEFVNWCVACGRRRG